MEKLLDLHQESYDETRPVICFDESSKLLREHMRDPLPAQPGAVAREDIVAERAPTALGDAPRTGRPPRLLPDQFDQLTATLVAAPFDAGIDAPAWTPPLVSECIADTFGVEYSLAHIYRVMRKAGLSVQTARPIHYKADPAEQ